jgi:uncharacterized protein
LASKGTDPQLHAADKHLEAAPLQCFRARRAVLPSYVLVYTSADCAAGAKAECKDSSGATPLHRACSALQQPAVVLLLGACPALVNAVDAQGDTALHVIVSVGQDPRSVQIARVLVRRGADLEIKNKAGEAPLALFGGQLPASIASALTGEDDDMQDDGVCEELV